MPQEDDNYGTLDASFKAAGGEEGVKKLVNDFYDNMEALAEARNILNMHPKDLSASRDKLFRFLCGWLGGPRLYREKYGPISIPMAHKQFKVTESDRDAWMLCMEKAIADQPYTPKFKRYLYEQLMVPANRVHQVNVAAK
nr:group II truncated hemoglobin [Aliikangiella sp. G2MR2-5]